MSISRRVPQQERGERRVAQLLETAASVLAEVGYDAATMTTIAERAGSSIGAVYQYFPNKEALLKALRAQYSSEMAEHWGNFIASAENMSLETMAHRFIDIMVSFVEAHPAYFAVLDAPIRYKRDQAAKVRFRMQLAEVFQSKNPALSQEHAYRIANVSLQIVKSMNLLYAEASTKERQELVKEYKRALTGYLRLSLES